MDKGRNIKDIHFILNSSKRVKQLNKCFLFILSDDNKTICAGNEPIIFLICLEILYISKVCLKNR
jgi:hypothetical protein